MPDLVNDPQYDGIDAPQTFPEYEGQSWEEWKAKADKWRDWSAKQKDAVAKLVERGAQDGLSGDEALGRAGFQDKKEEGKYMFRLFGNQGMFATDGAAVDPNLSYDWSTGMKTYRPGTDNAGQSIPINATEKAEHAKAQKYGAAGLQGYGQMANAEKFNQIKAAHFFTDKATGKSYNVRNDGTVEWKDQYGRTTAPPPNWTGPKKEDAPPGYKGEVPQPGVPNGGLPADAGNGDPNGAGGPGGGISDYPGGGGGSGDPNLDTDTQGFGLGRSKQSYLDQMAKRNYQNDLYGAALGVRFDPETGGYSRIADYGDAPPGTDPTQMNPPPDSMAYGNDGQAIDASGTPYGNDTKVNQYGDSGTAEQASYWVPPGGEGQTPAQPQAGGDPSLGPLGMQQKTVEAMFLSPQMEGIGADLQQGIERLKREGRPQDIPKLMEAAQGQALQARQGLQQQAMGYLSSEDPYKDLPAYQGDLQANTQKYIAELSNKLGMSELDLRKYLGEMSNATQQDQMRMQQELGLSDLDLKRAGLDLQRDSMNSDMDYKNRMMTLQDEWNKMGDKTTQRGQDIQKEMQLLGYQREDAASKRNFYGGLGQTAVGMIPSFAKMLKPAAKPIATTLAGTAGTAGAGGGTAALSGLGLAGGIAGGAALTGLGGYMGGRAAQDLGVNKNIGRAIGAFNPMVGGASTAYGLGKKLFGSIFSDVTTKENVESYTPGLEHLLEIKPISFEYISRRFGPSGKQTGVRAQDLEKVLPSAVTTDPETQKKMVDYSEVLMTNVNATRELSEKLNSLERNLASKFKTSKRKKGKA